jgi:threonine dehydrogenase-like Zn-dependent dehydrogenase
MKAFVALERGRFEITDVPVPEIGDDDILIKLETAAICGSDVHIYKEEMDPLCGYPVIMGHENAGVIAAKGKNVPDELWQVGDRVTSENTVSVCGKCYACKTSDFVACEHRRGMGIAADGVFAEYVKLPGDILRLYPSCLIKIPDNISFEEAPLMEPAANGYKAVFQEGGLIAGENVIIAGAGALGLYSANMASIGGASHVILLVRKSTAQFKIDAALKMGVTDVVYSDDPDEAAQKIAELTDGGADLAIEATGAAGVLDFCLKNVRVKGRVVRIAIDDTPYGFGLNSITLRSVTLIGHMGYDSISWQNVVRLASQGRVDLRTPVTYKFPLEKTREGFELMAKGQACKVIISIS